MVAASTFVRTFSTHDQEEFAKVSGDRNPLHLDPVLARRLLFGQAVVHGVHTLLWAIDQICSVEPDFVSLLSLRASFNSPAPIGRVLLLTYEKLENGKLKARVECGGTAILRLTAVPSGTPIMRWQGDERLPFGACRDVDLSQLAQMKGEEALTLPACWQELLPNLAARFSPGQIAVLLATTRLVGMTCPGLHSVFSGLDLSFEGTANSSLRYEVRRFDTRFSLIDIAVAGEGVHGSLQVFRRPSPVQQISIAEAKALVSEAEFSDCRAIVIGGSRGLGEVTAKLLAAGGASVVVTFSQGVDDANRLAEEASEYDLDLTVRHHDVLTAENPALGVRPTHLFYFATPRISVGRKGSFNAEHFAAMLEFYVTGLARTVQWLDTQTGGSRCTVWTPSTVFLDTFDPSFPEYIAAKACAEALGCSLGRLLPHLAFATTRLPRLPSDQTQSVTQINVGNAADLLTEMLREVITAEGYPAKAEDEGCPRGLL